ncbi:MAG TPA: hypothetical protein DHW64_14575 [Chitinophagaceae bacterium]|jgi:hypothetical protein|nr:hypothetical protein [Chitinophagaceae bacterium]
MTGFAKTVLPLSKKRLKQLLLSLLVFMLSCGQQQNTYPVAENALDAGREFIDACLKGDFAKAKWYMVDDSTNLGHLERAEAKFRTYDKEGRQQLRTASINISEVSDVDTVTSIIYYSNSFDQQPLKVKVVKQAEKWLVDFKYTFNPNL